MHAANNVHVFSAKVAAVFRVSTELIRCLRSKSSYPRGRESTIIRYAGRYLVAIGLAVDLQRVLHQATDGGVSPLCNHKSIFPEY